MPNLQYNWSDRLFRVDDRYESLEARINQLKAAVEGMHKKMDQFIDFKKWEFLEQKEIYDQEKREWEQERTQLQKELQHYKSLLQESFPCDVSTIPREIELRYMEPDCKEYVDRNPLSCSSKDHQQEISLVQDLPTYNSSSQTYATDLVNNAIKSPSEHPKPYKCLECGKSFRYKFNLKSHLVRCVPINPEYSCVFCDQTFFQLEEFRKHLETWHDSTVYDDPSGDLTPKPLPFVWGATIINDKESIELQHEPTVTKEEETRQQEQIVQQSVEVDQTAENLQDTLHISNEQNENPMIDLSASPSKMSSPSSSMHNPSEDSLPNPLPFVWDAIIRNDKRIEDNEKCNKPAAESIELQHEPTVTKEEETQQQEQIVQQSVEVDQTAENLQDTLHVSKEQNENPMIDLSASPSNMSSPSSSMQVHEKTSTDVSLSLTEPFVNRIDDQVRKKFHKDLMFLLNQHKCDNSDCVVDSFMYSLKHAKDCILGLSCHMYICRKKQSRLEHLKVCDTTCRECLIYNRVTVNEQYMKSILEMDCAAKQRASEGAVSLTTVTMYYVNYGVADIKEDNVDTETQNLSASEVDEAAEWELI